VLNDFVLLYNIVYTRVTLWYQRCSENMNEFLVLVEKTYNNKPFLVLTYLITFLLTYLLTYLLHGTETFFRS